MSLLRSSLADIFLFLPKMSPLRGSPIKPFVQSSKIKLISILLNQKNWC